MLINSFEFDFTFVVEDLLMDKPYPTTPRLTGEHFFSPTPNHQVNTSSALHHNHHLNWWAFLQPFPTPLGLMGEYFLSLSPQLPGL